MIRRPPRSTLFPYTNALPIYALNMAGVANEYGAEAAVRAFEAGADLLLQPADPQTDRKSTRLNSSHPSISYAVFCLKKKKTQQHNDQLLQPPLVSIGAVTGCT